MLAIPRVQPRHSCSTGDGNLSWCLAYRLQSSETAGARMRVGTVGGRERIHAMEVAKAQRIDAMLMPSPSCEPAHGVKEHGYL